MTFDGLLCRIEAIWHKICNPSHSIIWKYHEFEEDKEVCPNGDILCKTCDRIYWCRTYEDKIKDD
jgi:hypothetical protein